MLNKRGQGLSTNTIILIILGLAVLVILVIGFTIGWQKILPWISSNNVDTVVNQCSSACVTSNKFGFCSDSKDLDDGENKISTSCATFSVISEYDKYGIEECTSITCDIPCEDIVVAGRAAVMKEACEETDDTITSIAKVDVGMQCCIPK